VTKVSLGLVGMVLAASDRPVSEPKDSILVNADDYGIDLIPSGGLFGIAEI